MSASFHVEVKSLIEDRVDGLIPLTREVRGSNAIQWAMIRTANEARCAVYDMRGIVAGVGANDPEIGLIQFKVGSGGQAVAFPGEWDKPINPILYKAFDLYMKLR